MKNLMHRPKIPPYGISVPDSPRPFMQIAMDLITGLPMSHGYDAILTIVDHGYTRAAILLLCQTTITGPGIAQLYLRHLYPWFGIPDKIISDRDPRFTLQFRQSLMEALGIDCNLSTVFHPQTDGLTEQTNQWVEQYLWLLSTNQEEWSTWLPVATAVHNNRTNATTKTSPHQLLLSFQPPLSPDRITSVKSPIVQDQMVLLQRHWEMATEAINRKVTVPEAKWSVGQQVWLEAKNIMLQYGSTKLAPRRHGPFKIR